MNKQREYSENTVSVGLLLAAASELCIRSGMSAFESQGGVKFDHESKRAMSNLIDASHKVSYWFDRLQERVVNNGEDKVQVFDTFIYNASKLAMIAMHYYNIFHCSNPTNQEDLDALYRVVENLSLKSTSGCFTQDYINNFKSTL